MRPSAAAQLGLSLGKHFVARGIARAIARLTIPFAATGYPFRSPDSPWSLVRRPVC